MSLKGLLKLLLSAPLLLLLALTFEREPAHSEELKIPIAPEQKYEALFSGNKDNGFYLHADNCDLLKKIRADFARWSKIDIGVAACEPDLYGFFKMNITAVTPKPFFTQRGLIPVGTGPNCFNFALVASGVLPYQRSSTDEELNYHLTSAECTPVLPSELQVGDIIRLWDEQDRVVHAYVYLNSVFGFTKDGASNYQPPLVRRHKAIQHDFLATRADYFRCGKASSNPRLLPYEERLHSLVFSSGQPDKEAFRQLNAELLGLFQTEQFQEDKLELNAMMDQIDHIIGKPRLIGLPSWPWNRLLH
jgi:hypothetical protein